MRFQVWCKQLGNLYTLLNAEITSPWNWSANYFDPEITYVLAAYHKPTECFFYRHDKNKFTLGNQPEWIRVRGLARFADAELNAQQTTVIEPTKHWEKNELRIHGTDYLNLSELSSIPLIFGYIWSPYIDWGSWLSSGLRPMAMGCWIQLWSTPNWRCCTVSNWISGWIMLKVENLTRSSMDWIWMGLGLKRGSRWCV